VGYVGSVTVLKDEEEGRRRKEEGNINLHGKDEGRRNNEE
jgi:hypothetical protein